MSSFTIFQIAHNIYKKFIALYKIFIRFEYFINIQGGPSEVIQSNISKTSREKCFV